MALIALSWCMTSGFHRSSGGVQALEALRLSFEPYGIGKEGMGMDRETRPPDEV